MKNPKLLLKEGKAFAVEGKKKVEITSNVKVAEDGKTATIRVDFNGDPTVLTLHNGQEIQVNEKTGVLTQMTVK